MAFCLDRAENHAALLSRSGFECDVFSQDGGGFRKGIHFREIIGFSP